MNNNRFIDQLAGRSKMTRRDFKKTMAALGLGVATFPGSQNVFAASEDNPVVFTWEGYDDAGLHPSYATKHGESPNFTFFGDEEEAFAKMRAGFKPDVTQPCSYKIPTWTDAGILAPIDTSRLKNWGDVVPSLKEIPGVTRDGNRYWVCTDWGQTSVIYRADLVDVSGGESWELMWDERYKGRLSMLDSLIDGVMVAAIVAGAKDPFNMTADEVEHTKQLLRQQLPLLRFYANSPTDVQQALASGELVAAVAWNDSYNALRSDGIDVKFMKPKEGAMTWTCGLCLMSDANPKVVDRAYDFIDSMLSPESGAWEITEFGYGHANQKAYDLVSEADLTARGLSRNPDELLNSGIFQIPIGNEPELQAMFEEVKAGL